MFSSHSSCQLHSFTPSHTGSTLFSIEAKSVWCSLPLQRHLAPLVHHCLHLPSKGSSRGRVVTPQLLKGQGWFQLHFGKFTCLLIGKLVVTVCLVTTDLQAAKLWPGKPNLYLVLWLKIQFLKKVLKCKLMQNAGIFRCFDFSSQREKAELYG